MSDMWFSRWLAGEKERTDEKQVLRGGWRDMFDAFIDQWRDLRMGVICVGLGALKTAQAKVLNLLEPVKLTVWKVMIELQ